MKRLFDEELSFPELNLHDLNLPEIKKLHLKKHEGKKGTGMTVFSIIGVVALVSLAGYLIYKLVSKESCCCDCEDLEYTDDFFDVECDENGCSYADESDFA